MSTFSFSQLNMYLEEVMPALLNSLQGTDYHYLKIAQHALVYHHQGNNSKILANRLLQSIWKQKLIYKLKSVKNKPLPPPTLKKSILFDSGRVFKDPEGNSVSVYFKAFLEAGKKENYTHLIVPNGNHNAPCDLHLKDHPHLASLPLDDAEIRLLKDVQATLNRIRKNKALPEGSFDQISSAFHRFFEEFHYYFQLLQSQGIEQVFATNHYHQEGLIAACRILKIKFIEIQHGLISLNDLYYVYDQKLLPKSDLKQAFFPDLILLYGTFWKDLLKKGGEHRDSEMKVLGDYVYKHKSIDGYRKTKENKIFIGAQKNMSKSYLAYINTLLKSMEKHPEWKLILKLHPLEKHPDHYNEIKHPQLEIHWNDSDLLQLLSRSKIQISVYSTTLFDALGLDVQNYSLQNYTDYKDYAKEMIDIGIALPLDFDEDPIQKFLSSERNNELRREDVYAPIDESLLKQLINQ